MNQTININLGGYAFTMDKNAYDLLDVYIESLENHFQYEQGGEEILSDIERRLAELFQEKMKKGAIVTKRIVRSAIHQMGDTSFFEEDHHQEVYPQDGPSIKVGRRLYRDGEEKVIGGVCSGLAQYFGIEDPVWVRIFFVIFSIIGGSTFILYVVLWAIVPLAKTRSDRLAMRGERIDIDSITRAVREEFYDLRDTLDHFKKKIEKKTNDYDRYCFFDFDKLFQKDSKYSK